MAYDPISRRHFLRGMGHALWIPFLPSLVPKAHAATTKPPVRFVAMTGVNGMYPQDFFPNATASTIYNGIQDVRYKALSDFKGAAISNVLGTQFNSVINKINIIRGLDGTTDNPGGHSYPPTTTPPALSGSFAGNFGYSVDAVIANSSLVYPSVPQMRALRVCPHLRSDFNWCYSYDNHNNLSALASDTAVFQTLFQNLQPSGSGMSTPVTSAVDVRKKKVVDMVIQDYHALMNSSKISANDIANVQNFFDLLSDVQGRLTTPTTPPVQMSSCSKPTIKAATDIVTAYRNHMDMIVAAFACGLTRVAVMHIPHYSNDADAVAGSGGPPESHHAESHNVNSVPNDGNFLRYSQWQAARAADMITKLNAVTDSDGTTILDNSMVLWTNEMAEGKLHSLVSMPVVTAGGAGGKLNTGYYIDYRQQPLNTINADGYGYYEDLGRPYNEIFITAFNAFGMQPADYERNGQQGFGDYINSATYGKYFNAGKRNPLPFLFKG